MCDGECPSKSVSAYTHGFVCTCSSVLACWAILLTRGITAREINTGGGPSSAPSSEQSYQCSLISLQVQPNNCDKCWLKAGLVVL